MFQHSIPFSFSKSHLAAQSYSLIAARKSGLLPGQPQSCRRGSCNYGEEDAACQAGQVLPPVSEMTFALSAQPQLLLHMWSGTNKPFTLANTLNMLLDRVGVPTQPEMPEQRSFSVTLVSNSQNQSGEGTLYCLVIVLFITFMLYWRCKKGTQILRHANLLQGSAKECCTQSQTRSHYLFVQAEHAEIGPRKL